MAADRRAAAAAAAAEIFREYRVPCVTARCSTFRQTLAPRVLRYYSGGSYEKLARRAKYASTFTLCKQNVNRNPQLFAFDLGRRRRRRRTTGVLPALDP